MNQQMSHTSQRRQPHLYPELMNWGCASKNKLQNMEGFLQSTSAHGLSQFTSKRKLHNFFWAILCASAYIAIIWIIIELGKKFVDPNNLKTVVTLDMATRKETQSGT